MLTSGKHQYEPARARVPVWYVALGGLGFCGLLVTGNFAGTGHDFELGTTCAMVTLYTCYLIWRAHIPSTWTCSLKLLSPNSSIATTAAFPLLASLVLLSTGQFHPWQIAVWFFTMVLGLYFVQCATIVAWRSHNWCAGRFGGVDLFEHGDVGSLEYDRATRTLSVLDELGRRMDYYEVQSEIYEALTKSNRLRQDFYQKVEKADFEYKTYSLSVDELWKDMREEGFEAPMTVHSRNGQGKTPLHVAVEWGDLGILELLLQSGADPAATDAKGFTALDLAREYGLSRAMEILRTITARAPLSVSGEGPEMKKKAGF
jgi:Ankyrin repeat